MKIFPSLFLPMVVAVANVYSALPPLYQSLKEYEELLANPKLAEKLTSADYIQNIQRDESGFLIQTNKHTMRVDIIFDRQDMPGPAKFHFVFHAAEASPSK